jgi:2-keto-4-pentenoate hydratase/2-oxohepta-3-ene-1,7-dioic acid hydratase in catechol pathway
VSDSSSEELVMKIVRYKDPSDGKAKYGVLEGDVVYETEGVPYERISRTGKSCLLVEAKLLVPCEPINIIACGANYLDHIREVGIRPLKEPVFFIKPSASLIAHGEPIEYPPQSTRVDYEGELAVVLKRSLRRASPDSVADSILGYTCSNDVTARDIQNDQGNLIRVTHAKAFDTFCPVGPWLVTDLNTKSLSLTTTVNGTTRQSGNTKDMLFSIPELLSYVSHVMSLEAGDLILTGTPAGIGAVVPGDEVAVTIEGIGTLRNRVIARMSPR